MDAITQTPERIIDPQTCVGPGIILLILDLFFILVMVVSLFLIVLGITGLIKYKKGDQNRATAKNKLLTGFVILVLNIVFFVVSTKILSIC
jgi:hypothetical protein